MQIDGPLWEYSYGSAESCLLYLETFIWDSYEYAWFLYWILKSEEENNDINYAN